MRDKESSPRKSSCKATKGEKKKERRGGKEGGGIGEREKEIMKDVASSSAFLSSSPPLGKVMEETRERERAGGER